MNLIDDIKLPGTLSRIIANATALYHVRIEVRYFKIKLSNIIFVKYTLPCKSVQ